MCGECKNKILSGHGRSPESAELFSLKKVKSRGGWVHKPLLSLLIVDQRGGILRAASSPVSCSESGAGWA